LEEEEKEMTSKDKPKKKYRTVYKSNRELQGGKLK